MAIKHKQIDRQDHEFYTHFYDGVYKTYWILMQTGAQQNAIFNCTWKKIAASISESEVKNEIFSQA